MQSNQGVAGSLDLEGVESSYAASNLGSILYALVRSHVPRIVVELGTYYGYSSLHFAAALRDNAKCHSRMYLIDLWSKYPYRHCSLETARRNFERNGLLSLSNCDITFEEGDAFEAADRFHDGTIDFLHIDISNTGDKLKRLLELWGPKMALSRNALIIVEGGSKERDEVGWMIEHKMSLIRDLLSSDWLNERFHHFTFQPFPSLSVMRCRDDSAT